MPSLKSLIFPILFLTVATASSRAASEASWKEEQNLTREARRHLLFSVETPGSELDPEDGNEAKLSFEGETFYQKLAKLFAHAEVVPLSEVQPTFTLGRLASSKDPDVPMEMFLEIRSLDESRGPISLGNFEVAIGGKHHDRFEYRNHFDELREQSCVREEDRKIARLTQIGMPSDCYHYDRYVRKLGSDGNFLDDKCERTHVVHEGNYYRVTQRAQLRRSGDFWVVRYDLRVQRKSSRIIGVTDSTKTYYGYFFEPLAACESEG